MNIRIRVFLNVWVLLACLTASGIAWAQAGRVVLAVGDVTAMRGKTWLRLAADAPVYVGDAVLTGVQSNAQLRFSDSALLALKPESEFRIEQYQFNGQQDGTEIAVFRLVKGGFRTITGQIGKLNRDQYQVLTTQATIGVRGTDYHLQRCDPGACQDAEAGLYGAVYRGRIAATNRAGEVEFGGGEFFHVANFDTLPQRIPPPAFMSPAPDMSSRAPLPPISGPPDRGEPPPTYIPIPPGAGSGPLPPPPPIDEAAPPGINFFVPLIITPGPTVVRPPNPPRPGPTPHTTSPPRGPNTTSGPTATAPAGTALSKSGASSKPPLAGKPKLRTTVQSTPVPVAPKVVAPVQGTPNAVLPGTGTPPKTKKKPFNQNAPPPPSIN
jgi:hypothetical protein